MNYQTKLAQLYARKNNIERTSVNWLTLTDAQDNKALRYVLYSMEEVDQRYRDRTIEAAKKIIGHLEGTDREFKYQGSITTKTEIKQSSDIDLVVITNIAFDLENGVPNPFPYKGELTEDLQKLRRGCEHRMQSVYDEVDISGAKSIAVYPTNPRRKVDVVVAHWYKTRQNYATGDWQENGIRLYNRRENKREDADFPFLRARNINHHHASVGIKKMIRFLKNFRADFEINGLTSFQINAIAYNLNYQPSATSPELGWLRELHFSLPKHGYSKHFFAPCGKEKAKVDHDPMLDKALSQLIADAAKNRLYNF